jgi:hypothetical protein
VVAALHGQGCGLLSTSAAPSFGPSPLHSGVDSFFLVCLSPPLSAHPR